MSSARTINKELFGKTSDGKDVYIFTLTCDKISVRVINFGCVIKDILVPDKDGNIVDVNLGYDTFEGYENNPAFMGAICGRVSNRIDGASFQLDGAKYDVSKNDALGNNMCHGGFKGFTRRCFDWKVNGIQLILTYTDVDGAEGFPGDVMVTVTYELTSESGLMIDYKATTTKPTPIDLSNHFMINLAGHSAGYVGDHVVSVKASKYLEFSKKFIPTGKVLSVEDTSFDLRHPTKLDAVLDKNPAGDGLHHAMVLDGKSGEKKLVARVVHPASKRYMEVSSTQPIVVEYSCYYLDFLLKEAVCKGNTVYARSGGVLFMPQGFPDAVHHDHFPSTILRPGETYNTTSWYKFGVTE